MTNREAVENNNVLIFEAQDADDPAWEIIISTLKEHIPGFNVGYGNGNWMAFAIPKTKEMMNMKKYKVQYVDDTGANTYLTEYDSIEEADADIEKELDEVKEYFKGRDYNYGDFVDHDGIPYKEIWDSDSGEFARWYRYYEGEDNDWIEGRFEVERRMI